MIDDSMEDVGNADSLSHEGSKKSTGWKRLHSAKKILAKQGANQIAKMAFDVNEHRGKLNEASTPNSAEIPMSAENFDAPFYWFKDNIDVEDFVRMTSMN